MTVVLDEWSPPGFTGNRIRLIAFPGLPQGANMPDEKVNQSPEGTRDPGPASDSASATTRPHRKLLVLVTLGLVAVVALALAHVLRPNHLKGIFPSLHSSALLRPVTALSQPAPESLLSPSEVLESVGKSPVVPGKDTFPPLEGLAGSDYGTEKVACHPDLLSAVSESSAMDNASEAPPKPQAMEGPTRSPKIVETPIIVPRAPSRDPAPASHQLENTPVPPAKVVADTGHTLEGTGGKGPEGEAASNRKKTGIKRGPVTGGSPAAVVQTSHPSGSSESKRRVEDAEGKKERFELPGSLLIAIEDYEGSLSKWGLLVILDDSQAMGKKSKVWTASRSETARTLVAKLPEAMTPGSRIAVRDFLCSASSDKKAAGKCLSRMLYDWNDAPFKNLEDKLKGVDTAGRTDPCAAAAFAIRKDMTGLATVVPRVLIVTSGVTKCDPREILHAINQHKGPEKVIVDVVGLGMSARSAKGYAVVAKRAEGGFYKVDSPGDVDSFLKRYKKVLNKRTMEKVEVRGGNVVFTVKPNEEITLAPGTYSVVLPLVGGLKGAKRTIPDVKIRSGEATRIQVKIKKGRPVVKTAEI